jgi:uncharacterized oligopeptide transporter (OPT) family protein
MAPLPLPLTTNTISHLPNNGIRALAIKRLLARAVGKCKPPECKPATLKHTMIIAICLGVAVFLILMLALWWHCLRNRKTKGRFGKLAQKEDGHAVGNGMIAGDGVHGVVAALPSEKHSAGNGNTISAVGGSGSNGGGFSSLF